MDDLRERIDAEFVFLGNTVNDLNAFVDKKELTRTELAACGAYLLNFYNGIENILKQVLKSRAIVLNTGGDWHSRILHLAFSEKIISCELKESLSEYLGFRHVFVHGYSYTLKQEKMGHLITRADGIFKLFQEHIK